MDRPAQPRAIVPPPAALPADVDEVVLPSEMAAVVAAETEHLIADAKALTDAEQRARRLQAFAFDVDGVLTDGAIYIGNHGEAMKRFSVHDGLGLVMLRRAGLRLAIVTGRRSEIVERRAEELGIELVLQGVSDKAAGIDQVCAAFDIEPAALGYIGDDWPDLPALQRAGLAATVAEAPPELRDLAHWVASRPPGNGAVRELCEWLLRTRGDWAPTGDGTRA